MRISDAWRVLMGRNAQCHTAHITDECFAKLKRTGQAEILPAPLGTMWIKYMPGPTPADPARYSGEGCYVLKSEAK